MQEEQVRASDTTVPDDKGSRHPDPDKGDSEREDLGTCREVLQKLKKSAHAAPFLYPVDPQRLNIPDYYDKIKTPMDLSSITKKLDAGAYKSAQEFRADVSLMLDNCYTYNAPDSPVYKMGSSLEKYYKNLLDRVAGTRKSKEEDEDRKRAKKKGMGEEEAAQCTSTLNEMTKTKYRRFNWPFLEPVDKVLVPNYYTVIDSPMDLSTMRQKLASGQYRNVQEFIADFELMVSNCYLFNAKGSEVYVCATKLNALFRQLIDQKKKRTGEDAFKRIAELKSLIAGYEAELRKLEKKVGVNPVEFKYEEKKRLKRRIESLSAENLRSLLAYVQENSLATVDNDSNEVELNLDLLDHSTLRKISEIVREAYVEDQQVESESSSE